MAPEKTAEPIKPGEQEALYGIDKWLLTGRVAVRIKEDSWQASLTWQHARAKDQLRLSGPLGVGAVDVYLTDRYIRLVDAYGEVDSSSDPATLLMERLGFPVPLRDLQYWVLGLPSLVSPKFSVIETYESGRTKLMTQSGWQVRYKDYRKTGKWVLPAKIVAVKKGMRLVWVTDEWDFNG